MFFIVTWYWLRCVAIIYYVVNQNRHDVVSDVWCAVSTVSFLLYVKNQYVIRVHCSQGVLMDLNHIMKYFTSVLSCRLNILFPCSHWASLAFLPNNILTSGAIDVFGWKQFALRALCDMWSVTQSTKLVFGFSSPFVKPLNIFTKCVSVF